MSIEGKLEVTYHAKNRKEEEKIREAILMVKGVREALWSEVPVVPANEEQILGLYLDELSSPTMPPFVTGAWIRARLPNLSKHQIKDWVKQAYIESSLEYPGKGARRFTIEEAKQIGKIWHYTTMGIPPHMGALNAKMATLKAESYLKVG